MMDEHGWEKTYNGAKFTAGVLITFAVVSFILGVFSIAYTSGHVPEKLGALIILGEIVGTLLVLSFFAFFGFVLRVLLAIWEEVE
ncbi:MAG TPA: hypothetical protein VIJ86_05640 [Acidimicrobiales bacterium]